MSAKKVFLGVAALLIISVVGVVVYVASSLDGIVKSAIISYGSEVTQTRVGVSSVEIKLQSGEGKISGLSIANPPGFTDPDAIKLGLISTRIDTDSITKNPIVIDEILIRSPSIFYEINKSGVSNIDTLKKNISKATQTGESSTRKEAGDNDGIRLIIRKLTIENSKATVRVAAMGDRNLSATIPTIRLTNIGKKSGGASPARIAKAISKTLVDRVRGSVATLGVGKYIGKPADMFKKAIKGKIGKIGGNLGKAIPAGGSVSDAAKKAGGALKGLLGK